MKVGTALMLASSSVTLLMLLGKKKASQLHPSIPDLPDDLPDMQPVLPVGGYEDEESEEMWDPADGPEPTEADYDDRLPCVTDVSAPSAVAVLAGDDDGCLLPLAIQQKKNTTVPDAELPEHGGRPRWPVRTKNKRDVVVSYQDVRDKWHGRWGRRFGALRKGQTTRHHAGVDLPGDVGDVVVAAEAGKVEAIFPFTRGTWAIYVRSPDGTMINYGEVKKGSWNSFGIKVGDEVSEGQRLARVGAQTEGGAHMLHLEIYGPNVTLDAIRQGKMQWPYKGPAPANLLDPTSYLLAAQQRWFTEHPETT